MPTREDIVKEIKRSSKSTNNEIMMEAIASFNYWFPGKIEVVHTPDVPDPHPVAIVFRDHHWLNVLDEAQETITRFHSFPEPKNDEEKAEQYIQVGENSSLGEKLLGVLNIISEKAGGMAMVTSFEGCRSDCIIGFVDKDLVDYILEVNQIYYNGI